MSSIYTISKTQNNRKLKRPNFYNIFLNITLILLITAIILLVVNPSKYMSSINAGVNLFFLSVFPSLLPFLFLSKLLDGLGAFSKLDKFISPITTKLFKVPRVTSYPLLMSIVSGYPIGAKIIGDLRKDNLITDSEAKRMIVLSSTSGPIFVIGSVGAGMIKSTSIGGLIFLSHILGSLITAFIFTRKKPKDLPSSKLNIKSAETNLLSSATIGTIFSILTVAVYVSIFYMFIDMAYDLKILGYGSKIFEFLLNLLNINPQFGSGLASGLIEMTRGCKEIIAVGDNFYSLVFCSALISFGGLSIILQSLTFLSNTKIKPGFFIFFKFTQMIVTLFVAILVGLIFL